VTGAFLRDRTSYDGSYMAGLRSFNDSTSKRVLDLLETVLLKLRVESL